MIPGLPKADTTLWKFSDSGGVKKLLDLGFERRLGRGQAILLPKKYKG